MTKGRLGVEYRNHEPKPASTTRPGKSSASWTKNRAVDMIIEQAIEQAS